MQKKNLQTIIFIIFSDFLMFHQIVLSPNGKRWAIITYRIGIYELPDKLLIYVRLRMIEKYEISENCLIFIE